MIFIQIFKISIFNVAVFAKSILNLKNLIKFFKKILIINENYKYFWTKSFQNNNLQKIDKKPIFLKSFFAKSFNYLDSLNEIIIFKKKSSSLKKNNNFNFNVLNKIHNNVINKKNNFDLNLSFSKSLDFNGNIKSLISKNRSLLRNLIFFKNNKIFYFNKKIKKLVLIKKMDFLKNNEYTVINIINKSGFFLSQKDCLWFFDNNMIKLNGCVLKNFNSILKPKDVVNLIFNNYYYFYFKKGYNSFLKNSYKIKSKFWSINKNRFNSSKENYPDFILNYKYFNNDIPYFLEIDYITMTIFFINYDFKYKYSNYYFMNFFNLFTYRLYNWKYIT